MQLLRKLTARQPALPGWPLGLAAIVLALTCIGAPIPARTAAPGEPRPLCEICRRFWDTSPARIKLTLKFSRTYKEYLFCSLFCYCEFMEDYPGKEPESVLVINHATLAQELAGQIRLEKAVYLYGIEGDFEKTNEPFTAAFATEKQAKEAQAELGGELLNYEDVLDRVTELTDEYEPEPKMDYVPQRHRR